MPNTHYIITNEVGNPVQRVQGGKAYPSTLDNLILSLAFMEEEGVQVDWTYKL